jgi:hypothetical protein
MSAEDAVVNGKAPVRPGSHHDRQGHSSLVNVQPARLSDLQPKYAQKIQHNNEDADAHGWYAGLSKFSL